VIDQTNPGVAAYLLLHQSARRVSIVVVDDHDLARYAEVVKCGQDIAERRDDVVLLVKGRHNDAD
jgi:hypothetical protein